MAAPNMMAIGAEEQSLALTFFGRQNLQNVGPTTDVPRWMNTKKLKQRQYLSAATGNTHGLRAVDYQETQWPLPRMFGDESYAFTMVDIEDPRYLEEKTEMSKELIQHTSNQQIIDQEWRKTYVKLREYEVRKGKLPHNASEKAKQELTEKIAAQKSHLLELQRQKDMIFNAIETIYERCAAIKAQIKKEQDLEATVEEMTNRIKDRAGQEL